MKEEKKVKSSIIDDFIKYAKEQFGYDIVLKTCEEPDTFASVFGASFLNSDVVMESVESFEDEWCYEGESISASISISFDFMKENQMGALYLDNLEWAA